jgi:hypothetical protein
MSLKLKGQVERLKQFGIKEVYPSIKNTSEGTWMQRYAELMSDPDELVKDYQMNVRDIVNKKRQKYKYIIKGSDVYEFDSINNTMAQLPRSMKFEDLAGKKGYLSVATQPDPGVGHVSVLRRKPVEYFGENEEILSRLPLKRYPSSKYHSLQNYYELMDSNSIDYRSPASSFYNTPLNRFVNHKQIVLTNPELSGKFQTTLPTCSLWTEFFSKHPEKTMEELSSMLDEIKDEPEYQFALYNIMDQSSHIPLDQIADEFQETIMYHKLMEMEEKGPTDVSYLSPEEIVDLRGIGRRKRK